MCTKMLGVFFIFVYPVLFLGANGQDLTCSTSWEPSCPSVRPLLSGPTCPEGFDQVEKYCFKVSDELVYWNESKALCEKMNAKLAEPRELLINSTAFANYLWQHSDDSSHYYRTFSLGGQFTNNSWKWLTGGNISSYYIPYYIGECLGIYIYDSGAYELSRSGEFSNISFNFQDIPCNISYMMKLQRTEYVVGTYRYICQATLENNSYGYCIENPKHFPVYYYSGQLVSMNTQQCQQNWCQDGIIQQYTCGNITTGCCEYRGKLYGDGDIIGPEVLTDDCSGCQQQVCQAGVIQWQDCTNCSVQCCFFNGASYQPGSHIQNACARLVCDGTTGQFNNHGIDYNCPKCKAYLDPHIVTYDQKWSSYSYQGCGNYSLSQTDISYQPTLAIYATFVPCGGGWDVTCVDTLTFKNDDHTVITIGYEDQEYKIQVNGEDYAMPTLPFSSPSIVQVLNTVYPVLSWKFGKCVSLQGSSGILVQFCGSSWSKQAYVWAGSDIVSGLKGLCGTANDDVDDDFTTRDGNTTSTWQRNPPVEFPLSWLASTTNNGSCDSRTVRVKRQAQNNCEADPSVLDNFQYECKIAVMRGFSYRESQEVLTIIDDCMFDLCNVNDPDEWILAVWETAMIQANIQEHTLNFTTTTTTSMTTTTTSEPTTVEPSTTTPDTPIECNPKKKCYRKGGFCTSSVETCDGFTTTGCWGQDCVCCLKTGRCKPKKKCWSKGGFCVTNPSNCKGKIINNGCRLENCYCCVNQPKC